MKSKYWQGFVLGNAIGLLVAVGLGWYGANVAEKYKTLAEQQTAQIVSQQQELDRIAAQNSLCSQKLQAVAQRNFELQAAMRQYQAEIQQGQMPTQLLTLLAKLLL